MPTLFAVYNLKEKQMTEEFDKYLINTKIPGIRGATWCTAFNTWKIDKVLAPAVSEPEGELPSEPPYMYIAKIEVSDLDAMVSFLGTDEGKKFVQSWSIYLDPKSIFTLGHRALGICSFMYSVRTRGVDDSPPWMMSVVVCLQVRTLHQIPLWLKNKIL